MADGGDGVISVVSNAAPKLVAQLRELCAAGDFAGAREHSPSAAAVDARPRSSSRIRFRRRPRLAMMGKMQNVLRLPLVPLAEKFEPTVRAALVSVGALTA